MNTDVWLTRTETVIAETLEQNAGQFVTPMDLLAAIYHTDRVEPDVSAECVARTHVHNLRAKGVAIVTGPRGAGYAMAVDGVAVAYEPRRYRAARARRRTLRCGQCATEQVFTDPSPRDVRDAIRSSDWEFRETDARDAWFCPPCVAEMDAADRRRRARALAEWRARNCLKKGVAA